MTREDEPIVVTAEDPGFSMIPYWVLFGASGNAVKLYGVLRKYANNDTKIAHPGRKRLADDMGFKDPKSLTPLIKELEKLGAIQVQRRRLEHFVNYYRIIHRQPARSTSSKPEPQPVVDVGENPPLGENKQVGEDLPEGRGESSPKVGEKTPHELDPLTRPTELEGDGASAAQEGTAVELPGMPGRTELERAKKPLEAQVAEWVYDQTGHGLKYMAMQQMAKDAMGDGYPARDIARAMVEMYRRNPNGTVTRSGLYRTLQGHGIGPAPKPSTTDQRVQSALDLKRQIREREAS